MNEKISSIPVLLILWIRDDFIEYQLAALAAVRSKSLYVAIDGPRHGANLLQDQKSIASIITKIRHSIFWDCSVKYLVRDSNKGLRVAVEEALDWFFDSVDFGIILEDDIIPTPTFFEFCSDILTRYYDCSSIFSVSGDGRSCISSRSLFSFHTSSFFFCWGWATWASRWHEYRIKSKTEFNLCSSILYSLYLSTKNKQFLDKLYQSLKDNRTNSWAFRVLLYCMNENYLHINPSHNLISNIGNDLKSTHTMTKAVPLESNEDLFLISQLPDGHNISHDYSLDRLIFEKVYMPKNLLRRIYCKLMQLFKSTIR